jgi:hypothetical protein
MSSPADIYMVTGGLMSYAPNLVDQFRRAASYIDRILKGEKPAELPVQAPAKYELVVNLKTARGARARNSALSARPRRRSHRIDLKSSNGSHVRYWPKADIPEALVLAPFWVHARVDTIPV